MPRITTPLRAPELAPGTWIQGPPVSLAAARGKVVLVEFWESTCINCHRTLPYLIAWHRRYARRGLVTVGVHTPEFDATRAPEVVAAAVDAADIPYPVLLDSGRETWTRFANKFWPARYLVDHRGYLRYEHVGEGAYAETERAIQDLLRQAGDDSEMPQVLEPLRPEDAPGAVCARPTPELHLGWHRGRMAGPERYRPGEVVAHPWEWWQAPEEGTFVVRGRWLHEAEYLECREARAELEWVAEAAGMQLVAGPGKGGDVAELEVDVWRGEGWEPVVGELAGEDVVDGRVAWGRVRMLRLVRGVELARRRVRVRVGTVGVRVWAVSFTGCVVG